MKKSNGRPHKPIYQLLRRDTRGHKNIFIRKQTSGYRLQRESVYSCLFFFLTGLHFFHLLVGLFLCCLFFYNCSFSISYFLNLRTSEIHLFYNLQLFYWHFLEILWLFIFLVFYNSSQEEDNILKNLLDVSFLRYKLVS